MSSEEWLKLDDEALETTTQNAIYDVFSRFSLPPGLLTGPIQAALEGKIPHCPAPIAAVYSEILRAALERWSLDAPDARVECWHNRCHESSSSVDYHLDNDEELRRRTGEVRTPRYGLIFHAGPPAANVGGTYFNPPLDDPSADPNLFRHPRYDTVISSQGRLTAFVPGRLIVFDGRCPHCVEPFASTDLPRVTIMANFWAN